MAKTAPVPASVPPPVQPRLPNVAPDQLVQTILHGMREKKAVDLTVLHVGALKNTVTEYYVLCTGGSDKQNQAIADSIEDEVRKTHSEKPWHVEGASRGEWILMDYVNVVVHIFLHRTRDFYQLEELWADAPREHWAE